MKMISIPAEGRRLRSYTLGAGFRTRCKYWWEGTWISGWWIAAQTFRSLQYVSKPALKWQDRMPSLWSAGESHPPRPKPKPSLFFRRRAVLLTPERWLLQVQPASCASSRWFRSNILGPISLGVSLCAPTLFATSPAQYLAERRQRDRFRRSPMGESYLGSCSDSDTF